MVEDLSMDLSLVEPPVTEKTHQNDKKALDLEALERDLEYFTMIYPEIANELHSSMPDIWKAAESIEPNKRPRYIIGKLEPFEDEPSPPADDKKKIESPLTSCGSNGNKYEGEVDENGLRNGLGTLYFASGVIYEGYWKDNKPHFRGRTIWKNGKVYVGGYSEGHKDGKGVYAWPTG